MSLLLLLITMQSNLRAKMCLFYNGATLPGPSLGLKVLRLNVFEDTITSKEKFIVVYIYISH